MHPPLLKICGITRLVDALLAVQQGANALGFVFWERSPRAVSVVQAREIVAALPVGVEKVGVFVNESPAQVGHIVRDVGLDIVQLHGDETPDGFADLDRPLFRSVTLDHVGECARSWPKGTTLLVDAHDPERRGGTGETVDWERAANAARHYPLLLAGGLTPGNVARAVAQVRPLGVDVSSGVEASPGVKDVDKVATFLAEARRAFARLKS